MSQIEKIREQLPEAGKDIRLNLQTVFQSTTLTPAQTWGTALAAAFASRNQVLAAAVLADAQGVVDTTVIEDAKAAAILMGMNNVYYRFRHMIGKDSYQSKPARLRMNALAKPLSNKGDFELFSLAVSAVNGCEMCVRSHEQVLVEHALTDEHVHDAVRIAATMQATAIALEVSDLTSVGAAVGASV